MLAGQPSAVTRSIGQSAPHCLLQLQNTGVMVCKAKCQLCMGKGLPLRNLGMMGVQGQNSALLGMGQAFARAESAPCMSVSFSIEPW